jgi:nitrite reductase (NO-forming)
MTFTDDQTLEGRLAALNDALSSRRTLFRKGVTLGLGASMLAPALRTRAQDDHGDDDHGDENASTPVPADDHTESDDHEATNAQHTETPAATGPVQPFELYDPVLPAVSAGPKDITMVARDVVRLVAPDVPFAGWSYDGTIPGRPIRVVEGDTVNVTFRVDSSANAHHSLDFHAAKTAPDVNFRTLNPGEELAWSFVPRHPGAFMYHCGTPKILMHIGSGLYGAIIVDPKEGWSPAHELILVQSDVYLAPGPDGISVPDYNRRLGGKEMDFVVFNGHASQYVDNPIPVPVGEPIRIFVVNAGPNVWSSFHVVGTVFDRAYINGSPKNQLFDLQSITIGPGDGACVEFTLEEPGMYPAVNHAFGHAAHGAVALLQAQ